MPIDSGELEDLIFACLESADFDAAIDELILARPADAARIRRVAGTLREIGAEAPIEPSAAADGATAMRHDRDDAFERGEVAGFRLLEKLGEGGMGVVYRAEQRLPRRIVALKVVRPAFLHFAGARERFEREVEACAQLDHPSIVPVLEVGTSDGLPWFSMALVRGRNLADVLESLRPRRPRDLTGSDLLLAVLAQGAMDVEPLLDTDTSSRHFTGSWVETVVRLLADVAGALQHAHARGVFHRDVKPSNLIVTPDGRAMLLDFGLAIIDDAQRLTGTHAIIGSLPYMPPEAVRGDERIGASAAQSDVYSLGVTLYEACSLINPFLGATAEVTRHRILEATPAPLRRLNPRVPRELELVCATAMAEDPRRRYGSMAEFAADLRAIQGGHAVSAVPETAWSRLRRYVRRNRLLVGAATAIVAVTTSAAFASWSLYRRSEDLRVVAEASRDHAEAEAHIAALALAHESLAVRRVSLAVNYLDRIPIARRGWEWRHLVRRLDLSAASVALDFEPADLDVAADAAHVAIAGSDRVVVFDPNGEPLASWPASLACAVECSPDGVEVAWADTRGVFVAGLGTNGSEPRQISKLEQREIAFDPPGERIVGVAADGKLSIWRLRDGRRTLSMGLGSPPDSLAWSPSGDVIAIGRAPHSLEFLDPATGTLTTTTVGHRGRIVALDFADDGQRLVTASLDRTVRLWSVADRAPIGAPLGLTDAPRAIAFRRAVDDEVLVGLGESIVRWSLRTGLNAGTLHGHLGEVLALGWLASDELVSIGTDRTMRRWRTSRDILPTIRPSGWSIRRVDCAGTAGLVAALPSIGPLRVFDVASGRMVYDGLVDGLSKGVWIAFDPRGDRLACVCNGRASILQVADWSIAEVIEVSGKNVVALCWAPDGASAVVVARDPRGGDGFLVVDPQDRTTRRELGAIATTSSTYAWLDRGRTFVAGGDFGLCTFAMGEDRVKHHAGLANSSSLAVLDLAVRPDGKALAILHERADGSGSSVRLLDFAAPATPPREFKAAGVRCITFDPTGERLLFATDDGALRIHDQERELVRLDVGEGAALTSIDLDSATGLLVSGDELGELRIWPVAPPDAVTSSVRELASRRR